jgi:nicotinamide-nucleotide amidase
VTDSDITRLARALGRLAKRRGVMIATAESCTGGGVAEAITRISGSSAWFDRGFVTYSNAAKRAMLGVRQRTLEVHGAVSEAVAREMARGALKKSGADAAVAITGIAGPGGGSRAKPVGLVWFAWARSGGEAVAAGRRFKGGRESVRRQSVALALEGLVAALR